MHVRVPAWQCSVDHYKSKTIQWSNGCCRASLPGSAMSNLNVLLGSVEIGVLISIFMFGLFNLQVFVYYRHYPNDPWAIRTLVSNSTVYLR
jgi:hypothetical protein